MEATPSYQFGPFRLEARGRLLFRDGQRLPLPPKAVDVLIALVESRGAAVGRDELLQRVWKDTTVEEGSLTSQISLLRKILSEINPRRKFIETIPKRGYRFIAPVEQVSAPLAGGERVMIAVLPFENLGRREEDDYLSDGLTEEMIACLGGLCPEQIGVIARTSAMHYKGSSKTIRDIGGELGVSYVLEGSVRRAGSRVRITAQLIRVSDQTHRWVESYEPDFTDVLALQRDVARFIASQIEVELAPSEACERARIDPQAYEAYLKGRFLWNRRTLQALQRSIRYFEKAIERQPEYAAAHAGLADVYLTLQDDGHLPSPEATSRAHAAATEALRIDDGLADAHTSLAHSYFHQFDWPAAESAFHRALALNPSCATAHFYYANLLLAVGRTGEAIDRAETAHSLDPVSLAAECNVASILFHAGHYPESIEHSRRVIEMDPDFARAQENLGRAYEQIGDVGRALTALRKAAATSGRSPRDLASLAHGYAVAGKPKQARELLKELRLVAKRKYVSAYCFAVIHCGLGEKDEAFAWLSRAHEEHSSEMPFLKVNPRLAPLRPDPRFRALLTRLDLGGRSQNR
jgi:TolB-like protein/Flp pilus assembly protein TadD